MTTRSPTLRSASLAAALFLVNVVCGTTATVTNAFAVVFTVMESLATLATVPITCCSSPCAKAAAAIREMQAMRIKARVFIFLLLRGLYAIPKRMSANFPPFAAGGMAAPDEPSRGALVIWNLHGCRDHANPKQNLRQPGEPGNSGSIARLAPLTRFALHDDVPDKRQRNKHAELPLKRDIGDKCRRDSREQHEPAGENDGKANPIPGEKLLRELRGRGAPATHSEKPQIQSEIGPQPNR